jgi:tetratricopeptide (TPR) repeat protein
MLSKGALVAGRFEVLGDPSRVAEARAEAVSALWQVGGEAILEREESFWLHGVDRQTGAPVLIDGRMKAPSFPGAWEKDIEAEALAREVLAMGSPFTATVRHAGPHVVYAAPPTGVRRGAFSAEEAALLTIQACEVTAALHAKGAAGRSFDPYNLRVVSEEGSRRIHWIIPGAPELGLLGYFERLTAVTGPHRALSERNEPIAWDLWGLVMFFLTLQPPGVSSPELDGFHAMAQDPALLPASVASLARLFFPLAEFMDVPDLGARLAEMPDVASLPRRGLDWDAVIAEGEALLAAEEEAFVPAIAHPLAAAYHQRASRAWAQGDLDAALVDAERAADLDGVYLPYATTRAILLEAHGRLDEAQSVIEAAIAASRGARRYRGSAPDSPDERYRPAPTDADRARAHAVRGSILLRQGAPAEAEIDLRRAVHLCPTSALYAHSLGVASFALGDFEAAAESEASSVELDPTNTRYRWALVKSLLRLGRGDEAREHAEAVLAQEPGVAEHRARFAELFERAG